MIRPLAITFLAAVLLSCALTALVRRFAPAIGLTDRPDGHRKLHGTPTPLGGGLAVFCAMLVAFGCVVLIPGGVGAAAQVRWLEGLLFFTGCATIVGVGLADDLVGLRGRQKLIGQIVAALIVILSGTLVQRVTLLGWQIELGLLAMPFTLFWLLGAINAVNLLDGMDGFAATLGIVASLTITVLAALFGQETVATIAAVLAGSLVGFLYFNFPPASIFLGDAGSMLIGMMVGVLAIHSSLKGPGTVLLAAPLAIGLLPVFDTTGAILRRTLTGRSIYTTDRGHLHHRLLEGLGTDRRVLAVVALACGVTSAAALASMILKNDLIALVTCVGVVATFIATGLFGRAEFLLFLRQCRDTGRPLLRSGGAGAGPARTTAIRLQGTRQWELLWATLTESADKLELTRIHFVLSLPAMQEAFDATWERPAGDDAGRRWHLHLPLVQGRESIGALTIAGRRNGAPASAHLAQLLDLLEPFEAQFLELAGARLPADEHAPRTEAHPRSRSIAPSPCARKVTR